MSRLERMRTISEIQPSAIHAEQDLSFEMGGPAYRMMQRLGVIQGAGPSVLRRSVWFILLAWVPLLLLAGWEGNAIGATPRSSLLLDFAAYARLFMAVPLLFG